MSDRSIRAERRDQASDRNLRFRMPCEFGPSCGPRRGPDGQTFEAKDGHRHTASVSYLTDAETLKWLLPPRCQLAGEPVVQIEHTYLHDVEWLSGRSYSLAAVNFMVRYEGPTETATGKYRSLLWENRCEPIMTGREELGMAKIYCELPPARVLGGRRSYSGVWEGFEFMRMELFDLKPAAAPSAPKSDGLIFHRYIPGLELGDQPAADEMVISAMAGREFTTVEFLRGKGSIQFRPATWEQMPTMYHIVNGLAGLPVIEIRGATYHHTKGVKDIHDVRRLR